MPKSSEKGQKDTILKQKKSDDIINQVNEDEDKITYKNEQISLFCILGDQKEVHEILESFEELEALSFAAEEEREFLEVKSIVESTGDVIVGEFREFDEIAESEKKQSPQFPVQSILTKDQISRKIVRDHVVNQGEKKISIRYKDQDVTTKIALMVDMEEFNANFPNITNGEQAAQFDYFDRAVFNAIITLYLSGYSSMPYIVIHRVMIGSSNTHTHPSKEQIERIKDSIKKMNGMWLDIDFSEEYSIFKKTATSARKKGRMIDIEFLSVGKGESRSAEGIVLIKAPLLYQYAKMKNQLAAINLKLLDIPVNMSKETIMIREYLNDRIEIMKSSQKVSRVILFDTLMKALPKYENKNESSVRSYILAIRKCAIKILDHWSDMKYISGYEIQGQGRKKFYKIIIDI